MMRINPSGVRDIYLTNRLTATSSDNHEKCNWWKLGCRERTKELSDSH